ncbi:MAG: hypothetical protein OXQ29_06855 [Rhodospirillaceae bacterium]|nr:hypothetical protein [Rhodospirillaceae bacterium]
MNGLKRGVPDFTRMRRALLAGLLGLGIVALCSGAALAQGTYGTQIGPIGFIDSATDDGGGRIRVSWSLQAEPPEGYRFSRSQPDKVCARWSVVENGVRGSSTETCFTGEASNQSDLLIDTGIGGDGPTTVYSVLLLTYYNGNLMLPLLEDRSIQRVEVTLNAPS